MALKNAWIASANPSAVANSNYINALYQEKYGRNATRAELDKFASSTVKDAANIILWQWLSPFSWTNNSATKTEPKQENSWMSGSNLSPEQTNSLQSLFSEIDNHPYYSTAQKQMMKYALSNSSASGNKIWTKEELARVLSDAAENAKTDLEPYYEKMKYEDLEDYKKSMEDLRLSTELYKQQEAKSYKELLMNTKQSIASRWATFGWFARKELWKEWALLDEWVEWRTPQGRRYDWEEYSNNMQIKARDLWIEAERKYWSSELSKVNVTQLASPYKSWTIDYSSSNYIPSYLAKQKWQSWYVRSDRETWSWYLWSYWLDRQKEEEKAKQANLAKYWLATNY